jgi:hypothetical protein
MMLRNVVLEITALAMVFAGAVSAQELTARDAFWSASDLISVAPNPAVHKTANSTRPRQPARASTEVAQLVAANGYGAPPKLVRAADNRLGLRCSLMLRNASNEYAEVTPGSVFHSGDHIRLSVLANEPGYLYVIQQGSTGAWSPVFPPANAAPDANKILAGQPQVVPSGKRAFAFDQNPGDEKLYVILSRTPIADIDRVIENLRTGKPAAPEQPATGGDSGAMVEAANKIPDEFVKGLASRDLSLVDEETVDETSKTDVQGEKAIYVVSKSAGPDSKSQVLLNLDLQHQ